MVAAVTGFPGRIRRRPHGGPAASRRYERRRPEKTPDDACGSAIGRAILNDAASLAAEVSTKSRQQFTFDLLSGTGSK
jgi:hypothetical protein